MNISSLSLRNFRNFSQVDEVEFKQNSLLVAAAPNATGKTNFLESMVVLLRAKSWRAFNQDLVSWGQDDFVLRGELDLVTGKATLAVHYHSPAKKIRVEENGSPASPVTFYSHYPFVLFLPEDTFIFARGPAARRNFLNRVLVATPNYVSTLVQYQRVLKQRNLALKQAGRFNDITAWSELLVEQAVAVWRSRQRLAQFIDTHLSKIYQQISGEDLNLKVKLDPKKTSAEDLQTRLEENFTQEKKQGFTSAGPHRDDLVVEVDGRPVNSSISQGQTRCVVIALKLAAHRFTEQVTGETPILLLDEVLSELDEERQGALLGNLPQAQTIVTTTTVP